MKITCKKKKYTEFFIVILAIHKQAHAKFRGVSRIFLMGCSKSYSPVFHIFPDFTIKIFSGGMLKPP